MYRKYCETQIPRCHSMFETTKQLEDRDSFKEQFVRRENPYQTRKTVTGYWEKIQ